MKANYIVDRENWQNGFDFSVPVQVRFSETDMFGHVNNTVPITYFEFARIEYLKSLGLMQNWLAKGDGLMPVVADMQVDYVQQVFFDETLAVHVKAEKVGNSSVDIHYWVTNEAGQSCFTGRGIMVQISKDTGKGHPWTQEEKQLFTAKRLISTKK